MALPDFTMRQLLEAGVHFGHQKHRWNPKMAPYLYGVRNNIHIIDLAQTVPSLHRALQAFVAIAFAILSFQFPDARGLTPASTAISFLRDLPWANLPIWLAVVIVMRDAIIVAGAVAYRFVVGHIEMAPTRLSKANTFLEFGVLALAMAAAGQLIGLFDHA